MKFDEGILLLHKAQRQFSCECLSFAGSQRARVVCLELEAGEVDNDFCNNTNKPDDHYRSCNTHQCPAKWWTGPWQHCSVTCGRGVHRRTVICTRSLRRDEQIALNDDECEASEKPSSIEPCHHERPCPVEKKAEWTGGPWSMVSLWRFPLIWKYWSPCEWGELYIRIKKIYYFFPYGHDGNALSVDGCIAFCVMIEMVLILC